MIKMQTRLPSGEPPAQGELVDVGGEPQRVNAISPSGQVLIDGHFAEERLWFDEKVLSIGYTDSLVKEFSLMSIQEVHCVAPPASELEERIHRTKRAAMGEQTLPTVGAADFLDMRSYHLIQSRPAKTRPNAFTLVRAIQEGTCSGKSI